MLQPSAEMARFGNRLKLFDWCRMCCLLACFTRRINDEDILPPSQQYVPRGYYYAEPDQLPDGVSHRFVRVPNEEGSPHVAGGCTLRNNATGGGGLKPRRESAVCENEESGTVLGCGNAGASMNSHYILAI